MCEKTDFPTGKMTRRGFAGLSAAGLLAACAKVDNGAEGNGAGGAAIAEREVAIPSPDGTIDGWLFHPSAGAHAAAILWPDIAGIRPASMAMARRLAGEGFAVVIANPYYRDVVGQQFEDFADLIGSGGFDIVSPWRDNHTPEGIARDADALISWLDSQPEVDTSKPVSACGYCMTGAWPLRAAATRPDRMGGAASLHGGGLVTDAEDSPHRLLVPDTRYFIGIAQNDHAKAPDEQGALTDAAEAVGAMAEVTVYPADHGWTVPDSSAYDKEQAEIAWERMLAAFRGA